VKLPAASKVLRWDTARLHDRAAVARLEASGEPFTVPAFCAALVAVLDAEAGPKDREWEAPWDRKELSCAGVRKGTY
jgi:hypothetical protein